MPAEVVIARNRLGALTRLKKPAEQIEQARRELAIAKLETYIAKVVEEAPALTAEEAARIAALLRPRGGAA